MVIPLIAALLTSTGIVAFIWYQALPDEKKKEYDSMVIAVLTMRFEELGVSIDSSDDLKTIETKASEVGVSKDTTRKTIKEVEKEARKHIGGWFS